MPLLLFIIITIVVVILPMCTDSAVPRGWFDSPGPCCSIAVQHLSQPGHPVGSKASWEPHTEGLSGGTELSLQRDTLSPERLHFLPPLCSHTQWGRQSPLAQELWWFLPAHAEDGHWGCSMHTPSQQEEIPSQLQGLKAALECQALARRCGWHFYLLGMAMQPDGGLLRAEHPLFHCVLALLLFWEAGWGL